MLCLGELVALLTIWVLALHHRRQSVPMSRPMKFFVRKVLIPFRNWTCCKRSEHEDDYGDDTEGEKSAKNNKVGPDTPSRPFVIPAGDMDSKPGSAATAREKEVSSDSLSRKFSPSKEETRSEMTWQEVAVTLDHLFLYIFIVIITLISVIIIAILYGRY